MRVVLQQPALTKYRVPVFRELASRPNIDLTVLYGETPGIPNVPAEGFEAAFIPIRRLCLPGHPVWHSAQLRACRDADVAILTWDVHYTSLLPALMRARVNRVRTVLWGHGFSKREASWRRGIRDWMGARADGVLLYNHRAARQLVEAGFQADRVFVAPNSLDQRPIGAAEEGWRANAEGLERFRAEHRLKDRPVVLFVSRLDPDNRVDVLLRAAARLRPSHPTLRLVIVGKGPDMDRLQRLTTELSLGETVTFVGALYEEQAIAPYFMSATVFCYPENIGLSLLHAFGYGVPVVTGDRIDAQNPEIEALEDGRNGLLYRSGDEVALAEVLGRVIDDGALRERLSQAARATVADRFNVGAMVDGIQQAIEGLSRYSA